MTSSEKFFYEVKQCKKNTVTGNPKRNQTWVAGMASDTHDHCTMATSQQCSEFFKYL